MSENLSRIISSINTGKKYPALSLVKSQPEIAAAISKLIKPTDPTGFSFNSKLKDSYNDINQGQLQAISDSIINRKKDNESILQLFPDIELAVQILVSSILSPKDMVKTEIIYKSKDSFLNSELMLKLSDVAKKNFEDYHRSKEILPNILREVLFTTGSYINVVLPENIVDEVINNNKSISTESITKSLENLFRFSKATDNQKLSVKNIGILGSPVANKINISTESIESDITISEENRVEKLLLEVTDNPHLLKLPNVKKANIKNFLRNKIGDVSLEDNTSNQKLSEFEFSTIAYKGNQTNTELFVSIPQQSETKRKAIGRPLVIKLPSESVIPVFVPGNEKDHVGYFVVIDIDGNPITSESNLKYTNGLHNLISQANNSQGLSSLLINKAKSNLQANADNSSIVLDNAMRVYANIVESDLVNRLRNGVYGIETSIGGNEQIYRIMLARALANKYTRLVYIPNEYVTYFAFKHYVNGVGKSYLDDVKILTSLRAILLFAKVMAETKNAINISHVNMTLDPNDPDPQKTIEVAIHEIIKMRQNYFPLGINTPVDLVNWVQRAGLEFSFEGHPGLPQTKFDFETKNLQHTVPDTELDELLRKQTYMAFGLTPEVIDQGFNVEFATTIVSNNILLSKRVLQLQNMFVTLLTDWCQKLLTNDVVARKEFKQVLRENKAIVEKTLTDEEKTSFSEDENKFYNYLIDKYIENIELDLPKPDETSLKTQVEAFDEYSEALEKALEYWVSSNIITNDVSGNVNSNVDSVKAVLKAYFIRKWMSENNFMPELADIVTSDEDGNPNLDLYNINKQHIESVGKSIIVFIKKMKAFKAAANKDLEDMDVEAGMTDSSSDTSTDDGGSGGDDFGMDDLGMGGDEGGDGSQEQSTTDETSTTEEPANPDENTQI